MVLGRWQKWPSYPCGENLLQNQETGDLETWYQRFKSYQLCSNNDPVLIFYLSTKGHLDFPTYLYGKKKKKKKKKNQELMEADVSYLTMKLYYPRVLIYINVKVNW